MADAAARLVAIEPLMMTRSACSPTVTAGEQGSPGHKTAMQLISMPTSVKVTQLLRWPAPRRLREPQLDVRHENAQGKPVASKPISWSSSSGHKGAVLANQEVPVPALKVGEAHPLTANAQGAGITAWRYKQK